MPAWLDRFARSLTQRVQGMFQSHSPEETLQGILDPTDPRMLIRTQGPSDWMCPYCMKTLIAPSWDGTAATLLGQDVIWEHLLVCVGKCNPNHPPPMKPLPILLEAVMPLRLEQWPSYQVSSAQGDWVCPHCLSTTGVLRRNWDGSEAPKEWFLPAAWQHLNICVDFNKTPLSPHDQLTVQNSLGKGDVRRRLMMRIASDPLFRISTEAGIWLDPINEVLVESINLNAIPWGPELQNRIADYLLQPQSPGWKTEWRVSKRPDELIRLAGRLSMRRQEAVSGEEIKRLREKVGELEASAENSEELQRDLAAARAVQIKLLPSKPPTLPGYDVSAFYQPCTELGGDMFHFLPVDEHHMGFLIGDVSGHGVGAAMIMAGTIKSFVVRSKNQTSPMAVTMAVCRDLIHDIPPGRFVSALYAVLNTQTGVIRYVRAGHNPPFLYDAKTRELKELNAMGLALGICKPEQFETRLKEAEVALQPGGIMVLYTDGVVETQNQQKVLFGEERLKKLIAENASRPSRRITEIIVDALQEHAGAGASMEDDVTLVVVRRPSG